MSERLPLNSSFDYEEESSAAPNNKKQEKPEQGEAPTSSSSAKQQQQNQDRENNNKDNNNSSSGKEQEQEQEEEEEEEHEDNNNNTVASSMFRCPVDLTCLYTAPLAAFSSWVSWSAHLVGQNPNNVNVVNDPLPPSFSSSSSSGSSSRTKYVRLSTGLSTSALDEADQQQQQKQQKRAAEIAAGVKLDDEEEEDLIGDDEDEFLGRKKKSRPAIEDDDEDENNTIKSFTSPLSRNENTTASSSKTTTTTANVVVGSTKISAEFEVWQKYIRDLSNFSAVDVDVALVASSSAIDAAPFVQLTVRGPVIPSLGRCRRSLENSAFIAPTSIEEWKEANPVRVMDVVEAFVLSVLAPEVVADDDTVQTIIETGTHILAMPAPALQEFLHSVSTFIKSCAVGVKLVIRDVDFTCEFDSARPSHAERFLVLDTSNPSFAKAREAGSSTSSSSAHGTFTSLFGGGSFSGTTSAASGGGFGFSAGDEGSCPEMAKNSFEADYSMLDIIRSVRNLIRRLLASIDDLRAVELRGCLIRDSDIDVGGFFSGKTSRFELDISSSSSSSSTSSSSAGGVNSTENNNQHDRRSDAASNSSSLEGDNNNNNNNNTNNNRRESSSSFPSRSGVISRRPKRLDGPAKLVIEHCGLSDSHLSAFVRLLRVETEKTRREIITYRAFPSSSSSSSAVNATSAATSSVAAASSSSSSVPFICPFVASLDTLRLSGQFYPMSVVGLATAMSDSWDDCKTNWAKRVSSSSSGNNNNAAAVESAVALVPFPLKQLDVPSSTVHIVRSAIDSRGLSSTINVRSVD